MAGEGGSSRGGSSGGKSGGKSGGGGSSERKIREVLKRDDEWIVKLRGANRAESVSSTKEEAVKDAA